jgi:uncharacterized membrane protein
MDFVNKNFSGVFKIIVGVIVFLLFIKVVPWIALGGLVIWAITKIIKHFKRWKQGNGFKKEEVKINNTVYDEKDEFDFSEKKIVDVDYKEV